MTKLEKDVSDNYSWDYIVSAQYIPDKEEIEVYDLNFEDICC